VAMGIATQLVLAPATRVSGALIAESATMDGTQ